MARLRFVLLVSLTALACCMAASADGSADSAAAKREATEVAKLPQQEPMPAQAELPEPAPAKGRAEDADKASAGQTEVASLWDATPPAGSAADLIETALEYVWSWDWDTTKACLQQAADTYPGTKDGARALVILACIHYYLGEGAQAEGTLSRGIAEHPDSETQAFAATMREFCLALNAKDFSTAESVLRSTASTWQGTELGGWAALQLGGLYRDYLGDFEGAIPNYQAAAEAYPGTLIAEEAEVSIAECLDWSMVHHAEAAAQFREALGHVKSPRLRVRALVELGLSLTWMQEYTEAFDLLTGFVDGNPDHPLVPVARAYRTLSASRLGHWDVAVADAEAFLAAPIGQHGHPWVHQCRQVLGQDAFRNSLLEEAEGQFRLASDALPYAYAKARSRASIAHCRAARGDLAGAAEAFLEAADYEAWGIDTPVLFYQSTASTAAARGNTAAVLRYLQQLGESASDPRVRQKISRGVVYVALAHIGGTDPTPDAPFGDAIVYTRWALAQLPQGPDAANAHFHLAWYTHWDDSPREAYTHAARALASQHLDADRAEEAWDLLRLSLPSMPLIPETLAWLAIACQRGEEPDWLGRRPTTLDAWRQVAHTLDTLLRTEAYYCPWAPLAAAHAHLEAQAPDNAIAALQMLIAGWPDRPEAEVAAAELASLLTHARPVAQAPASPRTSPPPHRTAARGAANSISKAKAAYHAETSRLQDIVRTTEDPDEAALAQLLTAFAHQRMGRVRVALQSYQKVIARYPSSAHATRALRHIAALCARPERIDDLLSLCSLLFRVDQQDPALLSTAAVEIPRAVAVAGRLRKAERLLRQLAADCAGKPAAGWATLALARIYARAAEPSKPAEDAFLTAARGYRSSPVANEAREALAKMYYARGAEAVASDDSLSALESYRKGVHVDPNGKRKGYKTILVGDLCYTLERWEEARAAAKEILKHPSPEFDRLHETQREFIALTYYRQGLYSEALERFQSLLPDCQDPDRRSALKGMIAEITAAIEAREENAPAPE